MPTGSLYHENSSSVAVDAVTTEFTSTASSRLASGTLLAGPPAILKEIRKAHQRPPPLTMSEVPSDVDECTDDSGSERRSDQCGVRAFRRAKTDGALYQKVSEERRLSCGESSPKEVERKRLIQQRRAHMEAKYGVKEKEAPSVLELGLSPLARRRAQFGSAKSFPQSEQGCRSASSDAVEVD
eukprot:TRINITY_DN1335_c0_g1_i2.p1 TRINITY_DN1335_c0_g1~~TRINITY_DN1335_c0_g1_i2.p1  ORF type:complete len:183 (-),score=19.84 TRINITY_DN1335_c0_g1_i2:203-751(-)